MRELLAASLLSLGLCVAPAPARAAETPLAVQVLEPSVSNPSPRSVADGSLDAHFRTFEEVAVDTREPSGAFWLKLLPPASGLPASLPALNVRKGRRIRIEIYVSSDSAERALPAVTGFPDFLGTQNVVYLLPSGLSAGQAVYARVDPNGGGGLPVFSIAPLNETFARAAGHARMIAMTFGALMVLALAALLIWFVLADKLLVLYAGLFSLHAVYIVYLSGQAFDWPVLSRALPLMSYMWNVPAALSGAVASLFVREIAELRRFSPKIYRIFGWFAVVFVVLAFANVARHFGLGELVAAIGNVFFVSTAIFVLVVAFLAWRRNNRAAGWFLVAWGLLETLTMVTAFRLLVADIQASAGLLYYGLPSSMVAAAVLIALGVADKLRDQRLALTEAERRAQTDPLTGVLNRRSLLERLDAACLRARARGLPLALLFIDLDHFKEINDSYGHPAGDACLKAIIEPIQSELRQSDVIGRYGGEEFVVILSSADAAAAHPIAERIRGRIADARVEGFGPTIRITCSIGVATSDLLGVWGERLIAHADEAVYAAKRSGRNQVQIAPALAA
ncbi:MAG TPA: diguanylate cyclase [Woeseiaceae bacterium]|nr:diguanylate cyclase [Woeseiaceae bacterium]